jgi:hypothetical protein
MENSNQFNLLKKAPYLPSLLQTHPHIASPETRHNTQFHRHFTYFTYFSLENNTKYSTKVRNMGATKICMKKDARLVSF